MTRWGEEGRGGHRIVSARSRRGPSQRERWDAPVLRALPAAWLSWSAADLRSRLAAEATKVRRETGAAARRVGRARRYIACAGSVRESVYGGGEGRGRGLARLRRRGRRQRWRQAASLRVGAPLGTDARRSLLQIRSSTSTRSSCARNRLKAISPRRLAHSRKGRGGRTRRSQPRPRRKGYGRRSYAS